MKNQEQTDLLKKLWEKAFQEINKHYALSTGNVSTVSRAWALTIIVPAMAWVIKDGTQPISAGAIIIIGLSLVSLLLDGIQYIYTAARCKWLMDELCKEVNFLRQIPEETRKTAQISFVMIVAKFCVLVINTILLIFVLLKQLYCHCL